MVNFELPNVPEDYVHRIGRTARAGQQGTAISLVCVDELKLLRDIEKVLGTKIEKVNLHGYDVDPGIKAEPIQNGRGSGRNNSGGRGNNGRGARNKSRARTSRRGSGGSRTSESQRSHAASGNR